ncbi:O-methyltransferase domain-containing protein [Lasiosphaeria miniovina]|uniref:O-methyltransferase domain-containing protein n=1 Tax=Lasiosphaeria miniovina TaxID=1954250 RepID=A0AA40ALE9_9PEZI|nr:O-methyltransferase domain-containing protein [Lasiosphaeria miniovina]KAK0717992.1 O-methyltransferase domain-containing protein [Lasiosphaeria miniovina]
MSPPTITKPADGSGGVALTKTKPNLSGVSETMLVVLTARAEDAHRPDSVLHDTWAADVLGKLDYGFGRRTPLNAGFFATVLLRARLLDAWAGAFLAAHPAATVLHLGCGLDSRALRLAPLWAGSSDLKAVRWLDVDVPAVAALRRQLMPAPDVTGKGEAEYALVEASVTDDAWLDAVPADRPTLVVMEGLLPYLAPADARRLVQRIAGRFPTGQLVFDVPGSWFLRMQALNRPISRTGAVMRFAMDDPEDLAAAHPALRATAVVRIWEMPGSETFAWWFRAMLWVCSWVPGLSTGLVSYFRYDF